MAPPDTVASGVVAPWYEELTGGGPHGWMKGWPTVP